MDIYENENLKKLMLECIKEIHEKTDYVRFDLNRIAIIHSADTKGKILGKCHRLSYNSKRFEIIIYRHKNRTIKGIKETIIHELIHTLDDCFNHGRNFKYVCDVVLRKVGYDCFSCHQDNVTNDYKLANFNYFNYCPKCKQITACGNRKTKRFYSDNFFHTACKCKIEHATNKQMQEIIKVWANA